MHIPTLADVALVNQASILATSTPTLDDILKILLTVVAAGTLGQGLASRWQAARQAREDDMATTAKLYDLYGRFFSTWKSWGDASYVTDGDVARAILAEATAAEGEMEALLMRVAAERRLTSDEIQ